MVLAQYCNLVRFGRKGYTLLIDGMHENAKLLADRLRELGGFDLVGDARSSCRWWRSTSRASGLRRVRHRLAAVGRTRLDASRLPMPPNADHVKMLRALVKLDLSHSMVTTLADDIATACETLEKKGGAHAAEREQVKTGTGY